MIRYFTFLIIFAYQGLSLAGGPAPFTEEAQVRGITYLLDQVWEVVPFGDGVAFADLDRDGDPDLITVGRTDGMLGIFENDGSGVFTARSAGPSVSAVVNGSGLSAADYDRDGDLDLYITCWDASNLLWRNDGGFQFTDVTGAAGVGDTGKTAGSAWGDYDGDGWLDLYTSNRESANALYRNKGDGSFEDMAVLLGVDQTDQPTFQASFLDFDQDGDADLYVSNDRGVGNCGTFKNFLYLNENGLFIDITDAETEGCTDSMSVAIGDFNRNGYLDLYVTSTGLGNALMVNQGDGSFLRSEAEAGVASMAVGWGSYFFDYDNDGYNDLYVANMSLENRLYRHGGVWPCVNLAENLNLNDAGMSFGVAGADIDGDGDVDLALTNRGEPVKLLINHEGETRQFARFKVVGLGADYWAPGAWVRLTTGGVSQIAEVVAGSNYKSQNEQTLHFGLDQQDTIDQVDVMWPGGESRTINSFTAGRVWTLYPQEKLGDGNQDGLWNLLDADTFCNCFTGQDPGAITPGCEMMDWEGDGDVDFQDLAHYLKSLIGVSSWGLDAPSWDVDGNGLVDTGDLVHGVNTTHCPK